MSVKFYKIILFFTKFTKLSLLTLGMSLIIVTIHKFRSDQYNELKVMYAILY